MTRRRVVLLGASNVTRAFPYLLGRAHRTLAGPLEVLGAIGHGRSYGTYSRVLLRGLPGIRECGLWARLREHEVETFALLTDVGNDILYGAEPDVILSWVQECLERLREARSRVSLGLLPMVSVESIRPFQFLVARTILFPFRTISLRETRDRARHVNSGLRDLALEYGAAVVEPAASWYGIDPIHVRRRAWDEAWGATLEPWSNGVAPEHPAGSPRVPRWGWRPEKRWILGRAVRRRQPCRSLENGSSVALY